MQAYWTYYAHSIPTFHLQIKETKIVHRQSFIYNARGIFRNIFHRILFIIRTLIKIFISERNGRPITVQFLSWYLQSGIPFKLCNGRIPPDMCYENIPENAQALKVRIVHKTPTNTNETFGFTTFFFLFW